MTRGGTWSTAALIAAVLAAGLLAACGGSGSTTTSSSTSGGTASQGGGAGSTGQSGSKNAQNGGSQGQGKGSGNSSGAGNGSGAVSAPLHVSGGGSGQFRTKGGDNSIQNYGEESDESELEEAAEALHAFFVARAEEDWTGACSYMSASVKKQLAQLSSQSPQLKSKGCAGTLQAFTQPLPNAERRETTVVDAGSLRREGERAFLVYYGAGKTAYAMPMSEEGGAWKVGLLSPTPLG